MTIQISDAQWCRLEALVDEYVRTAEANAIQARQIRAWMESQAYVGETGATDPGTEEAGQ